MIGALDGVNGLDAATRDSAIANIGAAISISGDYLHPGDRLTGHGLSVDRAVSGLETRPIRRPS
jgi:hypothetical protein